MRNFMLENDHDGPIHARNKIIAQQDIEILVDVYPPRTPTSNTKEVLMPADKAVVAYREWLAHRLGRVHPAHHQPCRAQGCTKEFRLTLTATTPYRHS